MKTNRYASLAAIVAAFWLAGAASVSRADTLKIDPVHSFGLFQIHHLSAGYVMGLFSGVNGTITNGDAPSFNVAIDTTTIETKFDRRNEDLKSADWLDTKQYPTMTFKSTAVKSAADNKMEVTGDLTIHGVTKSVTVTVENTGTGKGPKGETHVGYLTEFKISRADFGINPKAPEAMVGNEIKVTVAMECVGE